ncbi:MAG: helicase-related protein, partial [Rectinema subterraneum]|uniref:C-terminal helicase domain-containing protein n=1 Tax=Rectinema subterraneum TaxID=2653714 RepID=UPI003C7D5695
QRRRLDIEEWHDNSMFPERQVKEVTYRLTGEWEAFFNEVLDYWTSRAVAQEQGGTEQKKLIIWYATLSMLRCASSSPAAAAATLQKTLTEVDTETFERLEAETFDSIEQDELEASDDEPASGLENEPRLKALIAKAQALRGRKGDPKLETLVKILEQLLNEGFRPVVFCRYIATAEYVAQNLRERFKDCMIDAITGLYTPEERKARIEELMQADSPVLVATDCLSEGINLQDGFNAVVHYDMAWNPTRHEQREGRIDRFGQRSRIVRCVMLYGADNPVDGFVLKVILEKARRIRNELGILVSVPEDSPATRLAQMKAMLLRAARTDKKGQGLLDFFDEGEPRESEWQNYLERMKTIRTIFAQHRLKPEEVWPEYRKQVQSLGNSDTVQRFIGTAMTYLQQNSFEADHAGVFHFKPSLLPTVHRERFEAIDFGKESKIAFHYPTPDEARFIHRSNPFVSLTADIILETALEQSGPVGRESNPDHSPIRRASVFETNAVDVLTRLYLVRLRHDIAYTRGSETRRLLAEESIPVAVQGTAEPRIETSDGVDAYLDATPTGNLSRHVMVYQLEEALQWYMAHQDFFEQLARKRAQELLEDHRRVRDAALARGSYEVKPNLPVDLIGMFVLLPAEL